MSRAALLAFLETETKNLQQAGLIRPELELSAPPGPVLKVGDRERLAFVSSDYLGLANHPEVKKAAAAALETWGAGLASPRAVTGTLTLHRELEKAVASHIGTEDALVYPSGHHANTGLLESIIGERDYVFCDEMIRSSLADGIRLSRARAYSYRNADLEHLEDRLKRSRAARFRIIATDGVSPVTGRIAPLAEIYALATKYRATVLVDDSEGLGVLADGGRGSHAFAGLRDRLDLVTGSFGHALGGGGGGFVAGPATVLTWLRQKSRPYLTATALAPAAAAAALKAVELCLRGPQARQALDANLQTVKDAMTRDAGVIPSVAHPAVSVLIRNAVQAQKLTDLLYRQGIFLLGYCHPVVPEGQARICLRVTAQHRKEDLERTVKAIGEGMAELKVQL